MHGQKNIKLCCIIVPKYTVQKKRKIKISRKYNIKNEINYILRQTQVSYTLLT